MDHTLAYGKYYSLPYGDIALITNIHSREFGCQPELLGSLLDRIADPDSPLWPTGWPLLKFDRPLAAGANGGHGPIRYFVARYQPGRQITCRFAPSMGLVGSHTFSVQPSATGSVLRHELTGRTMGSTRIFWPLAIRWLHDALIEDLLDRTAVGVGEPPAHPAKWSWWVRQLRGFMVRKRGLDSARPASGVR